MSNVSTEQFEYFLSLLSALVEAQREQKVELERIGLSIDSIAGSLEDV
jgi:hypothetical protein